MLYIGKVSEPNAECDGTAQLRPRNKNRGRRRKRDEREAEESKDRDSDMCEPLLNHSDERVHVQLPPNTVQVHGLPGHCLERDVRDAAEATYGSVTEAHVLPGLFTALVSFLHHTAADAAVEANGSGLSVRNTVISGIDWPSEKLLQPSERMLQPCERLRKENHHIQQNELPIQRWPLHKIDRLLRSDAPRREYYKRKGELRSTNHWGQRKLFMSELEFLTLYGHESKVVVYAGAAPGAHLPYLARLFPKHEFHLYDPADYHFDKKKQTDSMYTFQQFFTDEIARAYSGQDVLFISDVRTGDPGAMDEEEVEEAVHEDMRLQMRWHLRMKPVRSMLKFRLPWGAGTTQYLDGDLHLPVWGRQTTTECRLVVPQNAALKEYDHTIYEEQMFYFNTRTRVEYSDHSVSGLVDGLCHCFDCASEVRIVSQYLASCKADTSEPIDAEEVARMCTENGKECATTSRDSLRVIVGHGQRWFKARRYDPQAGRIYDVERKEKAEEEQAQKYTRQPRKVRNDDILQELQ